MNPLPLTTPPVQPINAATQRRTPYQSPTARRLAKRSRDLITAVRALELDYDPEQMCPISMGDVSYLASALACSDAMLDECRKSRLAILQGFAHCRQN